MISLYVLLCRAVSLQTGCTMLCSAPTPFSRRRVSSSTTQSCSTASTTPVCWPSYLPYLGRLLWSLCVWGLPPSQPSSAVNHSTIPKTRVTRHLVLLRRPVHHDACPGAHGKANIAQEYDGNHEAVRGHCRRDCWCAMAAATPSAAVAAVPELGQLFHLHSLTLETFFIRCRCTRLLHQKLRRRMDTVLPSATPTARFRTSMAILSTSGFAGLPG